MPGPATCMYVTATSSGASGQLHGEGEAIKWPLTPGKTRTTRWEGRGVQTVVADQGDPLCTTDFSEGCRGICGSRGAMGAMGSRGGHGRNKSRGVSRLVVGGVLPATARAGSFRCAEILKVPGFLVPLHPPLGLDFMLALPTADEAGKAEEMLGSQPGLDPRCTPTPQGPSIALSGPDG